MRTSQMFGLSEDMKEFLATWAQERNLSVAEVIRSALAEYVGYDLAADEMSKVERRGRPRVYANKEERRKAARARNKERRQLAKQVLENYNKQLAAADRQKLADSLTRKAASS